MAVTVRIRLRPAGGSVIATIPKEALDDGGLHVGEEVIATLRKRRELLDELTGLVPEVGKWDRSWTRGRDRF